MKTIYLDANFKCHIIDDGTMTAIETDFFYGKCDAFIEGYQFVPSGESWTREDGEIFTGEMITPWKDYDELERMQMVYERQILAEYESALSEIEAALGCNT